MATSFRSLPVGQGDAFLVSTGPFAALIDGGRSRAALAPLITRRTPSQRLDVVICTHNDADHAEGLIGLLSRDDVAISEVWLPGQWASRLGDLLVDPLGFAFEIIERIHRLPKELLAKSLTELGDYYGEVTQGDTEGLPITNVVEEAIEVHPWEPEGRTGLPLVWLPPSMYRFGHVCTALFLEAVEAAERIRALASLAWRRASAVLWLDVSSPPGPMSGPIFPVNSRPIVRIPSPSMDALTYLALSVSNKRSLSFVFRPAGEVPPVLLTGDSDLSFSPSIPWTEGMIVTAPHHGSETNAQAYTRARRESPTSDTILWVRSDGRFKSRPGDSYLKQVHRFCTRCRPYSQAEQEVRFCTSGATWRALRTRRCSCN